MGDFNADHPEWAGPQWERQPKAEHLLERMTVLGYHLLNEPGFTTWSRGETDKVIDLGFASTQLAERILMYNPRGEWAETQDHYPIEIRINIETPRLRQNDRFAIKKADWEEIIKEVQQSNWLDPEPDIAVANLQRAVQDALEKHCQRQGQAIDLDQSGPKSGGASSGLQTSETEIPEDSGR